MAKIRINKIDAARRQIDAAIRMTFDGEDPVATHSVIAGGHRIIRDICEKRGDIESYLRFTDWIASGYERDFWRLFNASANFLKHADEDADHIHELDEEITDFMIVCASRWYGDLGNARSVAMNTFCFWWAVQNPKVITPAFMSAVEKIRGREIVETAMRAMPHLSRADKIKAGRIALEGTKATQFG
jgi:hypothetical protein